MNENIPKTLKSKEQRNTVFYTNNYDLHVLY